MSSVSSLRWLTSVVVAVLTYALLVPVAYGLLQGMEYVGIVRSGEDTWGDAASLAFIALATSAGAKIGTTLRKKRRSGSARTGGRCH